MGDVKLKDILTIVLDFCLISSRVKGTCEWGIWGGCRASIDLDFPLDPSFCRLWNKQKYVSVDREKTR